MRNRVGPIGLIITGNRHGLGALALLPVLLLVAGCDFEQATNNLAGRSGENRTPPQSTAFYSAPVVGPVVVTPVPAEPAIEPEPIPEVIVPEPQPEPVAVVIPPPPEPVCVPKFREPCPGDE